MSKQLKPNTDTSEATMEFNHSTMLSQSPELHKFHICECLESINSSLINTIAKAIEVGARLTAVKSTLAHGTFTDWCIDNFPDKSVRSLQRYMKLYELRDKIDSKGSLGDAYRLLLSPESAKLLPESDSTPTAKDSVKAKRVFTVEADQFNLHFTEFIEAGVSKNKKQKFGIAKSAKGLQPSIFLQRHIPCIHMGITNRIDTMSEKIDIKLAKHILELTTPETNN